MDKWNIPPEEGGETAIEVTQFINAVRTLADELGMEALILGVSKILPDGEHACACVGVQGSMDQVDEMVKKMVKGMEKQKREKLL